MSVAVHHEGHHARRQYTRRHSQSKEKLLAPILRDSTNQRRHERYSLARPVPEEKAVDIVSITFLIGAFFMA